MSSTRLPGKVLADLAGKSMLARQVERLRTCTTLDELVIATSDRSSDDSLAELARHEGLRCIRGDESDVLSRYVIAARESNADLIVRLTADCPLIDASITDSVVRMATDPANPCDYASNTLVRSFPRGLDAEAFHRDVLERMARYATSTAAREHVTYFLHHERPDLFVTRDLVGETDDSDLRWTVDTPEDLELVRLIFSKADLARRQVSYSDLVALVRADPLLVGLNAHVVQKTH